MNDLISEKQTRQKRHGVYKRDKVTGCIVDDDAEGTWYIAFSANGRGRVKMALPGVRTRRQVEKIRDKKILDAYLDNDLDRAKNVTFEHFVKAVYLPYQKDHISIYESYEKFALRAAQFFKSKLLREIAKDPAEIERFRRHLRETPIKRGKKLTDQKPGLTTINLYTVKLSGIFSLAVRLKYCSENPCSAIKAFKVYNTRERVLSAKEETEILFPALTGFYEKYRPIVLLALHTGMREGEIVNLRWEWVNFEKEADGVIVLPKGKATKNRKGREVPLNAVSRKVLEELRTDGKSNGRVFIGKGYTPHNICVMVARICDRIGLPDVTMHTFRHTFSTRCDELGINPMHTQRVLGHSKLTQTADYTHPLTEVLSKSVKKLESYLNGSENVPGDL